MLRLDKSFTIMQVVLGCGVVALRCLSLVHIYRISDNYNF